MTGTDPVTVLFGPLTKAYYTPTGAVMGVFTSVDKVEEFHIILSSADLQFHRKKTFIYIKNSGFATI